MPSGQPVSKFRWRFFFNVVTNVHVSVNNSLNMDQIQFSPGGDIFVSYCPYCLYSQPRSRVNDIFEI